MELVDRNFVEKLAQKMEAQEKIFRDASLLDAAGDVREIVGREKQAEELVRYMRPYEKKFVVPLVSVHGRSGSGKSTLVRFICESFKDHISYCFVNLRSAKTIFGVVNSILGELGVENIKSAQGMNAGLEKIEDTIEKIADKSKVFVLVLDEFDVIFFDRRNSASDFVYKLLMLEENLKKKGFLTCIITISNNMLSDYELDDRVHSRIGTSEIFFEPYTKEDIINILGKRAADALVDGCIDGTVLEYCAEQSSLGHGDARRAIDLLRVSAELASLDGGKILQGHVDAALEKLQKDMVAVRLATSSYHHRVVCFAISRLAYLLEKDWHTTSRIFSQYQKLVSSKVKQLSYRRISQILIDLENTGLVRYHTASRGSYGRDTQFKLTDLPETVGATCFADAWKEIVLRKEMHVLEMKKLSMPDILYDPKSARAKLYIKQKEDEWQEFVSN